MKQFFFYITAGLIFGAALAFAMQKLSHNDSLPSYANAVNKAAPSVVNIYTTKMVARQTSGNQSHLNNLFLNNPKKAPQETQISLGSGVILHQQGFILTNLHVIEDAREILILLHDGRKALASIVGTDKDTDLAVLKIDVPDLQAVTLGNSEMTRIGDPVLAIGNPFGFGQSVTAGILSGKGRYGLNLNTYENFLQTDAAINIGSSGGALVNQYGDIIGINAALYSQSGGSQGIGLAIPIEIATKVLKDIIQHGQVVRGWLGLEVAQITPEIAAYFRLPVNEGIIISNVYTSSPAAIAGLRVGDILEQIGKTDIKNGHTGLLEVANLEPGEIINIQVLRKQQHLTLKVKVGIRPKT